MMTDTELIARDSQRDLGAELLASIQQMKAGKKAVVHKVDLSYVVEARQKVGFTQDQFARLLGVSKRTLQ